MVLPFVGTMLSSLKQELRIGLKTDYYNVTLK